MKQVLSKTGMIAPGVISSIMRSGLTGQLFMLGTGRRERLAIPSTHHFHRGLPLSQTPFSIRQSIKSLSTRDGAIGRDVMVKTE